MAKVIYKYPLEVTDLQSIEMPAGAELLSAQYQGATLMLWALVDPDATPEYRRIWIFGTGNPLPDITARHIATIQNPSYPLVWHVYEEQP